MNEEEIKEKAHEVMELGKHEKNLHHKKGFGGLLFIDLSMVKFCRLTRYIRLLEQERNNYKELYEKENKNWNELKEWLKEVEEVKYYMLCFQRYKVFIDKILNKMQEIERL